MQKKVIVNAYLSIGAKKLPTTEKADGNTRQCGLFDAAVQAAGARPRPTFRE